MLAHGTVYIQVKKQIRTNLTPIRLSHQANESYFIATKQKRTYLPTVQFVRNVQSD